MPTEEDDFREYEGFLNLLPLSPAERQSALSHPLFLTSARTGPRREAVAHLPLGKGQYAYVSQGGGSLVDGGVVTMSRDQYAAFAASRSLAHIPPVMVQLILEHGAIPAADEMPRCPHNVVVWKDGFALSFRNESDFRHACLKAGRPFIPGKNAPRPWILPITASLPLKVLGA
ncbi:hypothetical protein F2P47_07250 [Parvibaculum sedimenti]|uniref:Uncharacterized protein n=1 Tax=Parvibaculum sedimenti TaxID=2608632 RepID=A0A6N6VPM4_9HYPH|nr:hypothetical protein [Parvibaculum sedimenti]KAB7740834.1 hypothetical protein F2P47_07250 [Parvibaculum sedimenti]